MATAAEILGARRAEQVFGPDAREVTAEFRRLAQEFHPDRGGDARVFARLSVLYAAARRMISAGSYGTGFSALTDPVLIRTRRRAYRLSAKVTAGDSCDVFAATYDGDEDALVKVARSTRDNDLLASEGASLKLLLSNAPTFDHLSPYLPRYLESFGYRQPGEKRPHQAIAFAATQNLFSLRMVRESPLYPAGVHPKDAAWMLRRILLGLGLAHKVGRVHGAVLPEHVLIEPAEHGVVLIDWKYAVEPGAKVPAISSAYRSFYPPEILAKEPVGPGTDIFMAAGLMVYVLGGTGRLSAPLRAFFRGCRQEPLRRRPSDAFALLEEYDELIERMWGPRRFRPFAMST